MRRETLLWIAMMLSLPMTSFAAARSDPVCAKLWQTTGTLREETYDLPRSFEIPDGQVIPGFHVKSLYRVDGSRFVPESIQESDCYLDRILTPEIRAVLIESAQDALARGRRTSPSVLLNAMSDVTRRRLNMHFRSTTPTSDGLVAFLDFVAFDYGIKGFDYPNPSQLEREAYSHGIHAETLISKLIWLKYLGHLGVNEATLKSLIEYLKSQDASIKQRSP